MRLPLKYNQTPKCPVYPMLEALLGLGTSNRRVEISELVHNWLVKINRLRQIKSGEEKQRFVIRRMTSAAIVEVKHYCQV